MHSLVIAHVSDPAPTSVSLRLWKSLSASESLDSHDDHERRHRLFNISYAITESVKRIIILFACVKESASVLQRFPYLYLSPWTTLTGESRRVGGVMSTKIGSLAVPWPTPLFVARTGESSTVMALELHIDHCSVLRPLFQCSSGSCNRNVRLEADPRVRAVPPFHYSTVPLFHSTIPFHSTVPLNLDSHIIRPLSTH